jgi:hypothetical protein
VPQGQFGGGSRHAIDTNRGRGRHAARRTKGLTTPRRRPVRGR